MNKRLETEKQAVRISITLEHKCRPLGSRPELWSRRMHLSIPLAEDPVDRSSPRAKAHSRLSRLGDRVGACWKGL